MIDVGPYRKLIAALVGAALMAVNEGLLPDAASSWLTVVISFLTALGVYMAPNTPNIQAPDAGERLRTGD